VRHLQAGVATAGLELAAASQTTAAADSGPQQSLFKTESLDARRNGMAAAAADASATVQSTTASFPVIKLTAAEHLPEQLIRKLIKSFSGTRLAIRDRMMAAQGATAFVPADRDSPTASLTAKKDRYFELSAEQPVP
jgi:hypothetical protein